VDHLRNLRTYGGRTEQPGLADRRRAGQCHQRPATRSIPGNGVYEFLPELSRGNGVPTPTLRAEYTTVELNYGAGKAFEAALAAEQSKLNGETLWYRLVVGGNTPLYVCLRPRPSLASILDERADQSLPDQVKGLIAKMTVETLNLRTNMLVNVTPEPAH